MNATKLVAPAIESERERRIERLEELKWPFGRFIIDAEIQAELEQVAERLNCSEEQAREALNGYRTKARKVKRQGPLVVEKVRIVRPDGSLRITRRRASRSIRGGYDR